jgi:hypothetical protein
MPVPAGNLTDSAPPDQLIFPDIVVRGAARQPGQSTRAPPLPRQRRARPATGGSTQRTGPCAAAPARSGTPTARTVPPARVGVEEALHARKEQSREALTRRDAAQGSPWEAGDDSHTPVFEMLTAALRAGSRFSDRLIQLVKLGIGVSYKVVGRAADGGAESLAGSDTRSTSRKARQAGFQRPQLTAVQASTLHHTGTA